MLDIMSYSCELKIAGSYVSVKKYSNDRLFNYQVKKSQNNTGSKGQSNKVLDNFLRSSIRARKRIFDIISCNVDVIPDYHGNIQRPKFWTLTFAENVQNVKEANKEFTDFNKRLSYHLYGLNRNVLKYVCIPEFQKRGAIHFHVLYFNLPYVDQKEFSKIWDNGFVFVESVKDTDKIENFAKYVCKYISKENSKGESNFEIYKEKDLLNTKRYFCSRGLRRPHLYKLNVDTHLYNCLLSMLNDFHESSFEYKNEYIGEVQLNNYVIKEDFIKVLQGFVNVVFTKMKDMYNMDSWSIFRRLKNFNNTKEDKEIFLELRELGWI